MISRSCPRLTILLLSIKTSPYNLQDSLPAIRPKLCSKLLLYLPHLPRPCHSLPELPNGVGEILLRYGVLADHAVGDVGGLVELVDKAVQILPGIWA